MKNRHESGDWNDTVAIDDEDTAPHGPGRRGRPIWAVGEARPYPPERVSLGRWMLGGLKAGFFVSPGVGHAQPSPFQVLLLTVLASGLLLGLARLEVPGPALFDWRAWLVPWWMTLLSLGWLLAKWRRIKPRSLLDNSPLSDLLQRLVPLDRLPELIRDGHIQALAVTASSYSSGEHVTFFEGDKRLMPWVRSQRFSVRDHITHAHLLDHRLP